MSATSKTEAQKQAQKRYMEKYVEVKVRMTHERREYVKLHSDRFDKGSTTAFINRAIDETMERDKRPERPDSLVTPGVQVKAEEQGYQKSEKADASQTARVKVLMIEADDTPAEPVRVFVRQADDTPAEPRTITVSTAEPLTPDLGSVPITPTPGRANPEPDIRLDTISKPLAATYEETVKDLRLAAREAAHADYLAGMSPNDIAVKHGLPYNTVSSWAKRYWRDDTREVKAKKQPPIPVKKQPIPADTKEAARADYATGMRIAHISKKHGLPESTIRTWAKRDWEKPGQ